MITEEKVLDVILNIYWDFKSSKKVEYYSVLHCLKTSLSIKNPLNYIVIANVLRKNYKALFYLQQMRQYLTDIHIEQFNFYISCGNKDMKNAAKWYLKDYI